MKAYVSYSPPHRPGIDHAIDLETDKVPPNHSQHRISPREQKVRKAYIDKFGQRGWIRPSKSPSACPIIFVNVKDTDDLRLVVDYRPINRITRKNRYPVPLIDALLDRIPRRARYFAKFDIKDAFHLIRMREGDEWKTAWKCIFGLYEYLVMPQGLANSGGTFQAFIDHIMAMSEAEFFAYLDDILIWAETREELRRKTRIVL